MVTRRQQRQITKWFFLKCCRVPNWNPKPSIPFYYWFIAEIWGVCWILYNFNKSGNEKLIKFWKNFKLKSRHDKTIHITSKFHNNKIYRSLYNTQLLFNNNLLNIQNVSAIVCCELWNGGHSFVILLLVVAHESLFYQIVHYRRIS